MTDMDQLEKLVEERFQDTLVATDPADDILNLSISTLDLESGDTTRPEVSKLDVLQRWRELVKMMRLHEAFLDYGAFLTNALEALEQTHSSAYKHCRCLLDLLKQTVANNDHDDSLECRFVTLIEIMVSYSPGWTPSDTVETFWVRIMQRLPAKAAPINFRRKAYRILVSLSWVPSSKGLLTACSFEDKRSFDPEKVIPMVKNHFQRIHQKYLYLPRHDSVNQILDRLKDETDVCLGITSDLDGVVRTLACPTLAFTNRNLMEISLSLSPFAGNIIGQNNDCWPCSFTPFHITSFQGGLAIYDK